VSGRNYFNAELVEKMALNLQTDRTKLPHETLSDREYQILCQIALGESAETIAGNLSLSIHTVYSYRNRIMDKLGLKSNVELTQYALQNKLIEL
jgi:DNA-binding NarL/FixJ family response regulator